MYSKLEVINQMLGVMGELPVNTLSSPHTIVSAGLQELENESIRVQARGWWFNQETPTLTPQSGTNFINLPNNTLQVDTLTQFPEVAARGTRLFNATTSSYEFTAPVDVRLTRYLDFDELPYLARFYVAAGAKLAVQSNYDGDGTKMRKLSQDQSVAYSELHAEHIRSRRANLINRPNFAAAMQWATGNTFRIP